MYFRLTVDYQHVLKFCMLFCHTGRFIFDSRTIKILYRFNKDEIKSLLICNRTLYEFIIAYKI